MANQIDATTIGQLAAQYAPDVPLEILGAVFKTESGYGSNPAAYVPNSDGAIGAGQILSKALGAKYGNFESYLPGGNPLNSEHSTIAALRKINDDWKKSGESIEEFSKLYFGPGKDRYGNTAENHYVPKLLAAIKGQSNDQQYWALVNGALGGKNQPLMDTGTPSNTLSENRLQWMLDNGGPAKPKQEPEKLDTSATFATAAKSQADTIVESISQSYKELADAKTDLAKSEGTAKVELAKQTEALLSSMGLNLNDSTSQISQTAQALQIAVGNLRANQDKLNKDRQNPIFAIFDQATGGRMSTMHRSRIEQNAAEVAILSKNIQELQSVAQRQIALQPHVSESAIEKEIQAKGRMYIAEAKVNANKLGLEQYVKETELQHRMELQEARNALAQQRIDLQASRDAMNAARAAVGVGRSFSERQQKATIEALEEQYVETAKAVGFTDVIAYTKLLANPSYRHLVDFGVDANGKLPHALVQLKMQLGKMDPAQVVMYREAFNEGTGWAVPNSQMTNGIPGIDYNPANVMERVKSAKGPMEKALLSGELIEAVAQKKRDFILNTGRQEDQEINPYTSNFYRVAEFAKLPEFVKPNPVVDRVSKSKLYLDLQEKNASNSLDKQNVSDDEVLKHAQVLVQSKQLTLEEASRQVADYYKAQVAMNNYAKQFKELGLPEQENYQVPVNNSNQRLEFAKRPGKDGQEVPNYQMFDLTSEQKVTALILARKNSFAGKLPGAMLHTAMTRIMELISGPENQNKATDGATAK